MFLTVAKDLRTGTGATLQEAWLQCGKPKTYQTWHVPEDATVNAEGHILSASREEPVLICTVVNGKDQGEGATMAARKLLRLSHRNYEYRGYNITVRAKKFSAEFRVGKDCFAYLHQAMRHIDKLCRANGEVA